MSREYNPEDGILTMNTLLELLKPGQRKGSKPRCHLLTHGNPEQVADQLTKLIAPYGLVTADDHWMPQGFDETTEAQLHKAPDLLSVDVHGKALASWWLADANPASTTPNWDIAATCTIEGKKGLFLVEAKAHSDELKSNDRCSGSKKNFERIGEAIHEANQSLNAAQPGWNLSHTSHYQLSNRFAWSWKLASYGIPTILVYLGFLRANEMRNSLDDEQTWKITLRDYARDIIPDSVWGSKLLIDGVPIYPLIRSLEISLDSIAQCPVPLGLR